jgi:EAL domain-containing protein (putative c-di-GMP-specific phosphodiesterase class I)
MLTSTTAATPRFLLKAGGPFQGRSYSTAQHPLCSSTALRSRPWLQRLRRALSEDSFVLHYQPILSLQSGRISHYEALVRLADEPDGSLVAPGSFLPAAERYGFIGEIDRCVIAKAISSLSRMRRHVGAAGEQMSIAVNLSALSTTDPGMLAHIQSELERHDVDPAQLIIEITETAAISDMQRAKRFCQAVQALGSAIALDDFGAGFGSFYYLKHLPFDYLKIDGSFIRTLTISPKDKLVVKALVDVARGMGKRTIAEFVNGEATIDLLKSYGVDYAQGFQVGKPTCSLLALALAV